MLFLLRQSFVLLCLNRFVLPKKIHGPSYGDGYDVDAVFDSVFDDITQLQNYQINEELEWLVKDGLIKKPEFEFVGYDK